VAKHTEAGTGIMDKLDDLRTDLLKLGHVDAKSVWKPMRGGRTNDIWRVETASGTLVCKLFRPKRGSPLFPNDPGAEAAALLALNGSGIAPDYIESCRTRVGTCLLYRHAPGTQWHKGAPAVAHVLAAGEGRKEPVAGRRADQVRCPARVRPEPWAGL